MDCKKKKKNSAINPYYFMVNKHFWKTKNHLIISLEQFHKKQNQHCKFVLLQNIMFRTP